MQLVSWCTVAVPLFSAAAFVLQQRLSLKGMVFMLSCFCAVALFPACVTIANAINICLLTMVLVSLGY